MPAISVRNLVKQYKDVRAVDGVSFDIRQGSVTGLLGGNGAGKTTTISMLTGVLTPTSGDIRVLGHDMVLDRYAALERMNFSSPYVDLIRRLTPRQNLRVYAGLYGLDGKQARERIAALAQDLELGEFIDRPCGKLSAGQQTRIALAKALVNAPDVLLLDEPTASLDPDTADRVRSMLQEYCRQNGTTVVLASHNMREVERLCDHVVILRRGRVVDEGSPQDLIARYGRADMEQVFLDIARARAEGEAA